MLTEMDGYQVPSHIFILPRTLGETIKATAEAARNSGELMEPRVVLYAEKMGAFQCRTCEYSRPTNATHGRCEIMAGTISLDEGCCAAWEPSKVQLHLYREPSGM